MTVHETGPGKRDHDGGSTDGVKRVTSRVRHGRHDQRQATQRRNNGGSFGRKRPRRGSVTRGDDISNTSVRQTHSPSRRPRLDSDAGERQHVSPPVRQLRLTLGLTVRLTVRQRRGRLLGYSRSPTQLSFWSSILFTLCLGYSTVSHFINSKRFTPLSLTNSISRVTLSLSLLNSIWFTSTRRARTRAPAWSVTCNSRAGPTIGRSTRARRQRHKLWSGNQCPRKRPIEGRLLHTKRTTKSPSGTDCYTWRVIIFPVAERPCWTAQVTGPQRVL